MHPDSTATLIILPSWRRRDTQRSSSWTNTRVSLPTGAVTFHFTDIVGSARLLAALADQYESVLGMHPRVLRTAIAGHGGATTGITAAVAAGGVM